MAIYVQSFGAEHIDRLTTLCAQTTEPEVKAFLEVIKCIIEAGRNTAQIQEHLLVINIHRDYTEMQEKFKFL